MSFELTTEQCEAIELATQDNNENIKIIAYAGAGKTSVLRLIAEKFQQQNKRCIYLAFNKAIVEEAQGKMPANTDVKTFNSLAYRNVDRDITKKMNLGLSLGYQNFCKVFKLDENIIFNVIGEPYLPKSNEMLFPLEPISPIPINSKKFFKLCVKHFIFILKIILLKLKMNILKKLYYVFVRNLR